MRFILVFFLKYYIYIYVNFITPTNKVNFHAKSNLTSHTYICYTVTYNKSEELMIFASNSNKCKAESIFPTRLKMDCRQHNLKSIM